MCLLFNNEILKNAPEKGGRRRKADMTNHVFATMFVTLRADFQPVERRNCRQDSTKQARKHPNGSRCDRCSIENPPWEIERILKISAAETTVNIQQKKAP